MNTETGEKLLDSLYDGVYFVDADRQITYWNKSAERITGYTRAEVLGSSCADNMLRHVDAEGHELCTGGCPLLATMENGAPREAPVYLHHKLGHRVPVSLRTARVYDEDGAVTGALEIFSDASTALQILQEYEQLKQEAYVDPLTGIGNRRYGEMTLSTRSYDLQNNGIPFGVLYLDLDNFKQFNDGHGRQTGDEVLAMVARSISGALRKVDVVARWGGEEFVVILPAPDSAVLRSVAERVRLLIEKSFGMMEGDQLKVTVSIGGTLARPEDSVDALVQRADQLMYQSKAAGRNRVTVE